MESSKVVGCDLYNGSLTGGVACNMNANSNASANHAGPSVLISVCLNDQGGNVMDVSDKSMTLRAQEHGHQPIVCMERIGNPVVYPGIGITSPQNGNNQQPGDPCPTLTDDSRYYLVGKQEVNPDG